MLRALAGADDLEAAQARPLDELADQRGLIAVGERVDDAGRPGATGEQWPDERIRLHVDHHDVPAGLDRAQGMVDARRRIPRRLDHDLHARRGDQPVGVVGQPGRAVPVRVLRTAGGERRVRPAGRDQPFAHQARREIGDADDVDAGRAARLRQVERPEDTAADHRHADRARRRPRVPRAVPGASAPPRGHHRAPGGARMHASGSGTHRACLTPRCPAISRPRCTALRCARAPPRRPGGSGP